MFDMELKKITVLYIIKRQLSRYLGQIIKNQGDLTVLNKHIFL